MITSFKGKLALQVWTRKRSSLAQDLQRRALRKLLYLNGAVSLDDLRCPPGNRLEALSGDRQGQYSIRINDQWRVCFTWDGNNACDVEIVDYH